MDYHDGRMISSKSIAALAGLSGVLMTIPSSGCSSHRSCELDTENIILRALIVDYGDGVEAEIELANGAGDGYTSLELCSDSGDTLTVNGSRAEEIYVGDHYFYVVDFSEPSAAYEVVFTRDHEDESSSAEVLAPPPFELTAPEPLAQSSRAESLELAWEPGAPGEIQISIADELGVACLESGLEELVADTGALSLPAGTLAPGADIPEDGVCALDLTLSRRAVGEVSSHLSSVSTIDAIVARHRSIDSIP
jgi:hypothetical protein